MSKIYGYVRVSTKSQNEDRQLIAMREYGVPEEHITVEKQSGKDFNRPAYQKMVKKLRPGDKLVIKSLDRLGRNYEEIQEQWHLLQKKKGVSIVVLEMPILNTPENAEMVLQVLIEMMLQLLSYIAQNERESIRSRQREGIQAARARGVRFGRPKTALPDSFQEILSRWNGGEITAREAAELLGISRTTFFRRVREAAQSPCPPDAQEEDAADNAAAPAQEAPRGETAAETGPAPEPGRGARRGGQSALSADSSAETASCAPAAARQIPALARPAPQ